MNDINTIYNAIINRRGGSGGDSAPLFVEGVGDSNEGIFTPNEGQPT